MDMEGVALLRRNIEQGNVVRVDLLKWHVEEDGEKVIDLCVSIAGTLLTQVDWQAVSAALGGTDSWKVPVGDPRDAPARLRVVEVAEHFAEVFGAEVFQDGLKVELVLHGFDEHGEEQAVTYGPYMSLARENGSRVILTGAPEGYDGWGDLTMMAEGAQVKVAEAPAAETDGA